jgi:hypothetical protein
MKLLDVILKLPKPVDNIKKIKQEILVCEKQIGVYYKNIMVNEAQIDMSIRFDFKNTQELSLTNNLILVNVGLMTKIMELNEKISAFYKKIEMLKKNINPNSDWIGGIVPGELIDTPDGYRIRFDGQSRSFKYKNIINSEKLIGCDSKEDCRIKAEKYLYEYYDNLGKIVNKYRYVSPDVIEVQLTQDKTFITNSKFLNFVKEYRLGLKHDKKKDKYYVTYIESPKVTKLFTDLISKISKIKLSNGCDFDLREENLLETDNKAIALEYFNKNNMIKEKKVFNLDGLEMYVWLGGKFGGTVFQRKDQLKWSIVVKKPDGSVITKTLPFTEETKEQIYKEAIEIRNRLSDMYELTTNKIRIIDGDKIEVKLSKDQIMVTDYKFMSIVEKYPIYASKSMGDNSKYYASMMIGKEQKQFHNFVTSWNMVDHIDRNPLNNCLSNLRETTHKENNNNRSKSETTNAIELGVTYSEKDNAYKARIKQDGKEYSKQFSVKKYGKEKALMLAIETRRDFNRAFNCLNG